ncbi:L-lactate permease [Embleya sp. AB8]|uniref:L-lactate permease n=1 Tax=Embleya sp. AB8 TaxID=3156304 RepID=UPI003C760BA5
MYRQVTNPLDNLALSALLASAPLLVLLVLLGIVRMRSHWAALTGLGTAVLIAVAGYDMPFHLAADGAAEGAVFGLFPIVWIVLNAVWINKLQRASGHFDIIGRTFSSVSADIRIQAVLIAFCFGAMIESLSGFGTPIAITSLLLLTLGLEPLKAAAIAVFANTAPAAFGSVGNPIQTLAKVTSYSEHDIGVMVGRQSAIISVLVPFALLLILDGRRGLREVWPVALTAGLGFGIGQFLCSNYFAYQLTDLVAALVSMAAVVSLLRWWRPRGSVEPALAKPESVSFGTTAAAGAEPVVVDAGPVVVATAGGSGAGQPSAGPGAWVAPRGEAAPRPVHDPRREVLKAFSPYAILTVLFALVSYRGPVSRFVDEQDVSFHWPGLDVVGHTGKPVSITTFDFHWLGAAGTMLLLTGLLTILVLRVSPGRALRCYGEAFHQIRWATVTIACILALSYVMNLSGMALSLGTWFAGAGSAFALLSGLLGWFGVALTGSDTSSNALFGAMQVSAAKEVGISPLLMAATNSTGGVQGKAAAMQNLVIAASAVGLSGREGDILRKVIGWSLGVLAVLCVLAWLQSTSVLGWMVP